ncbi:MAG TPA: hypothetical protein VGH73_21020 [Thermoanaerobaculia bacterium]|jgi:hypothetical protein
MKNHRTVLLLLLAVALVASSCRSRTDRSAGTVVLSVSHFDGLPVSLSLSSTDTAPFQVKTITLRNFPKDPLGTTSDLQSIELRSYTITYRRRDAGTRVPPPAALGIFGLVPVNGNLDLNNLPFLTHDQLLSQPLRDLIDFGRDTETGTAVVVLDVTYQFFGRTLSGDEIASEPASFTIDVTP